MFFMRIFVCYATTLPIPAIAEIGIGLNGGRGAKPGSSPC
jgi:hypothetical protein